MILISKAIRSLYPDTEFIIEDEDINKITWVKNKPSNFEFSTEDEKQTLLDTLLAEVERLELVEQQSVYRQKRKMEYPPITDYIDGLVKGDQAQIDKYIADCLAVKAKYPKG